MAANKVILNGTTLVDLTSDTVAAENLLKGYTAHKADGTIITGTLFDGYAAVISLTDNLTTQDDVEITDQSGVPIQGQTVYYKQ